MIFFLAMLLASLLLDGMVRPRLARFRRWPGVLIHVLTMAGTFGLCLAASGTVAVAAGVTTASMALFVVTSNAKYAMLGEPLVFSDFALLLAMYRHPRFYFTAISVGQRWGLAIGAAIALLVLVPLSSLEPTPHLVGVGLVLLSGGAVTVLLAGPWTREWVPTPDLTGDLTRFGLIATLLLYWRRWRDTPDPVACPPLPRANEATATAPEIIVIVQCESFADPVEITGDTGDALPGLALARDRAWQWGNLEVSGFGAYTMRTEYGVLFGRSEAALGFRRYDPFLTARGEKSYALPALLNGIGYRCSFIHPHDLRFYGRDTLMPAMGFDGLIGEDAFAPRAASGGRYLDDATLGVALGDLIERADTPTMLYAVTMENHGPWETDDMQSAAGRRDAYLHHVRNSDAMLTALSDRLARDGRSALLVFFGDHRPSIPGVMMPGGPRHTPYVMLRFGSGKTRGADSQRVDLSPDALHHAILQCARPSRD